MSTLNCQISPEVWLGDKRGIASTGKLGPQTRWPTRKQRESTKIWKHSTFKITLKWVNTSYFCQHDVDAMLQRTLLIPAFTSEWSPLKAAFLVGFSSVILAVMIEHSFWKRRLRKKMDIEIWNIHTKQIAMYLSENSSESYKIIGFNFYIVW